MDGRRGQNVFTEGEDQGLNVISPPSSCVSELSSMILKQQRRSQTQQLYRIASATSEATVGVAGCISF